MDLVAEGKVIIEEFIANPALESILSPVQAFSRYIRVREYLCSVAKELVLVSSRGMKCLYHKGRLIVNGLSFIEMGTLAEMLDEHNCALETLWVSLGHGPGFDAQDHVPLDCSNVVLEYANLFATNFVDVMAAQTISVLKFSKRCSAANFVFKWHGAGHISDKIIPVFQAIANTGHKEELELLGNKIARLGFFVADPIEATEIRLFTAQLMDIFSVNRRAGFAKIKPLFARICAVHVILDATLAINAGDHTYGMQINNYKALVNHMAFAWNTAAGNNAVLKLLKFNKVYTSVNVRNANGTISQQKDPEFKRFWLPPLHETPQFGVV